MAHAPTEKFAAIVGPANTLTDRDDLTRYTHENRNIYIGLTPMVVKPGSTAEVAAILKLASESATPIVPQGGHTGHAGGGVPDESGTQIVVSMERMNAIEDVDTVENTATVQAGVILGQLQEAAAAADRLFPVSLGSQGSCQIGGNISTNAGGTGVLAYGNMREQVLGLEVVLASGEVWNGLRRLKKDNTGYSLKNLFIGAEGTLGIVTRAVLRLQPMPRGREVVWTALPSPENALKLLALALDMAGHGVTAFELIHRTPLEFALRHLSFARDPFPVRHEWYVLAEISSGRSQEDAQNLAESIFSRAMEDGVADDVVVSQNLAQRDAFWRIREDMPDTQKLEGGSIKHDISVPVHLMPKFIAKGWEIIAREFPGARPCIFGHLGDGNLHYNISQPEGGNRDDFLSQRNRISEPIYDLVRSMDGSISAEHGIGRMKRDLLARTRSSVELDMMRAIKKALDPQGIMNPGKVL
jgi:FAD/FMN-containing dehydrogenase